MLLIIFVFNRIVLNKNGPDGNHSDDDIETFIFNNNAEGCVDGPPNSQRFWDYISTNESDYLAGEAFYFLSETYIALSRLIASAHVDLYDGPVFHKAHPAFPISQILPKNSAAENIMDFEREINKLSDRSLLELVSKKNITVSSDLGKAGSLLILDDSGYYFADTKLTIEYAKWARYKAKEILIEHLQSASKPDPQSYRSWLILVKLDNDQKTIWGKISLHQTFIGSLADSIESETSPIGLIFDALPSMFQAGWTTPDLVQESLNSADYDYAKPLLVMLSGNSTKINNLINLSGPGLDIYDDISLAGRYTDLLCNHYYKKGKYEKAMIEVTRFWFDDMANHPMEWMCFDNYPGFLIKSFMYGRWDGARLPLFLHDYSHVVGDDPILSMGFEFFQRYNNEISKTFN